MTPKIIAVDFDGTLCEDRYPNIGEPNIPLLNALRELKKAGLIEIILWTCRKGNELDNAIRWLWNHDIQPDAVNSNLPRIIRAFGGDTRKVYADLYIDDKSFECKFDDFLNDDVDTTALTEEAYSKFVKGVIECRMYA